MIKPLPVLRSRFEASRLVLLVLMLPTLLLNGCALFPKGFNEAPLQPQPLTIDEWIGTTHNRELNHAIDREWWRAFNDPVLNVLVADALDNNSNLKLGKERVRQSRARAQQARAALFPSLSLNSQYARNKSSVNDGSMAANFIRQGVAPRINNVYGTGLDAAWELDLFGGRRYQSKSASARVTSAALEWQSLRLSIIAETINGYISARGLQQQKLLLERRIALLRQQQQLVKQKVDLGLATESDWLALKVVLSSREAGLPELDAAFHEILFGLASLTGKQARHYLAMFTIEADTKETLAKETPAKDNGKASLIQSDHTVALLPDIINGALPLGLKSTLLERRPDVVMAEYALVAASLDVAAIKAAFFPSINLTANIGYSAAEAGNVIEAASQKWLLAPFIRVPLFQGGALRAQFEQYKSAERQALLTYEQAVVQALNDAEKGLMRYRKERESYGRWVAATKASKALFQNVSALYERGLADRVALLQAEQRVVDNELATLQSRIDVSHHTVGLYKALGGGWTREAPEP